MENKISTLIMKNLIYNKIPEPTDNFVWICFLLLLLFLVLCIVSIAKKVKYNIKPVIFYIPLLTFLISCIGAAYGWIIMLDAISNIPEAQKFQAFANGIAVSAASMFIPGIIVVFESFICVVLITIDKNKKK